MAHLSSAASTPFTIDEALGMSLAEVARRIRGTLRRMDADVGFRLQEVAQFAIPPRGADLMRPKLGVSCVNVDVPDALWWFGVRDLRSLPHINFGPIPHLWFMVITCKDATTVSLQAGLPVPGVSHVDVRRAIAKAARGSPLETILARW